MVLKWSNYLKYLNNTADRFNEVPCVYKIAIPNPDQQNLMVVYVGQTDNLKRRIGEHLDINIESNEELFNIISSNNAFISAAIVRTQSERDGAERSLYNHYSQLGDLVNDPDHIPNVPLLNINFNN